MASLFLRKGQLANLAAAPHQPGTLSITTDERAIYLDLEDGSRIRFGDFIRVANAEELNSDKYKPYNTTALYYVSAVNGLYSFNGTSFDLINPDYTIQLGNLQSGINDVVKALENYATIEYANGIVAAEAAERSSEITRVEGLISDEAGSRASEIARVEDLIEALETELENMGAGATESYATKADLQAESEARVNADNAEAKARSDEDARLAGLISTEENSRKGEITRVEGLISTLTTKHNNFEASVAENYATKTNVEEAVASEASLRDAADVALGKRIDAEAKARGDEDTRLAGLIGGHDTAISGLQTTTSNLQTAINNEATARAEEDERLAGLIDGKQATITGAATTIVSNNLTVNRAVISNASGKVAVSDVTSTELGYLSGVTSAVQTQLNTLTTNLGNLDTRVGTLDTTLSGDIDDLEGRMDGAEAAIALRATTETLNAEIKKRGDDDIALGQRIDGVVSTANKNATDIDNLTTHMTQAKKDIAANTSAISSGDATTLAAAKSYADDEIAAKIGAETTARQQAITGVENAYKAADTALGTRIDNVNNAVTQEVTDRQQAIIGVENAYKAADAALKAELEAVINETMAEAADAMKFMGVAHSVNDLGTVGNDKELPVAAGWTYKVGTQFGNYKIGDLLIANKDQEGDSYEFGWSHVESGYEDNYDPALAGNAANKSVTLLSGVDADLGKIVFADNYTEATGGVKSTVSVSGTVTTVTTEMLWGSF